MSFVLNTFHIKFCLVSFDVSCFKCHSYLILKNVMPYINFVRILKWFCRIIFVIYHIVISFLFILVILLLGPRPKTHFFSLMQGPTVRRLVQTSSWPKTGQAQQVACWPKPTPSFPCERPAFSPAWPVRCYLLSQPAPTTLPSTCVFHQQPTHQALFPYYRILSLSHAWTSYISIIPCPARLWIAPCQLAGYSFPSLCKL